MRAKINLELEDRSGVWRELEVIIDSGASFPMMGTLLATSLNLAVPTTTSTLPLRTATGLIQEVVLNCVSSRSGSSVSSETPNRAAFRLFSVSTTLSN
jgi:hypothetical protein